MKAKIEPQNPQANLKNYEAAYQSFSWAEQEKNFTWHKTGKLNIVYEAVDRWAEDPKMAEHKALIFEKHGQTTVLTFRDLKEQSCRLANLFAQYGLAPGDRLFILLPHSTDMYVAMLACARLGVVFCPLYATSTYHELELRLESGEPKAVLTHSDLVERLPLEAMRRVKYVFLSEGPGNGLFRHEVGLASELPKMPAERTPLWLPADAPLYLIYTSGAAGPPIGVVHAHRDMVGILATGRDVLDLTPDSVLWTDGDPAWVTGTVYGAFCPWLSGITSVAQGDPFLASTWYRTLERHQVSVWYTTPQRIKGLLDAGDDLPSRYDLSALRHIATVGRPLAPEFFFWVKQNLKLSPHENWWMTETGMICLANFPSLPVKPGSMGKPVPGVEAAIVDEEGKTLPILTLGELAFKAGWPAMMTGIWRNEEKYRQYLHFEGWFLTGDMAVRDEDGYFFHHGRNDDLVKLGEHMVGPFEMEQVLCRHPAVSEAAVISKRARFFQAHIKAFVSVKPGFTPSAKLGHEIREFVASNLSWENPMLEIAFLDKLPKTRSGRILRRALRASELGLPTRDPSSMQD